jgi:DNA-binding GntR family transcriptional regulator
LRSGKAPVQISMIVIQSYRELTLIDTHFSKLYDNKTIESPEEITMSAVTRVPREETSLRQRATQALRVAILEGVFSPGQKLSERELCERLEVSRTCVRESLQHLQAEGLITIVPHRGPEVAVMSLQEVRDIYAVRATLESLAVRGFVTTATPAQKQVLRQHVEALRACIAAPDRATILTIKNQFYDTLIEGCGNSVVGQMLRQLNNRVTVLRRVSMARPGRLAETTAELDALVGAIEQGDAEQAAHLCDVHVRNASANALRNMEEAESPVRH